MNDIDATRFKRLGNSYNLHHMEWRDGLKPVRELRSVNSSQSVLPLKEGGTVLNVLIFSRVRFDSVEFRRRWQRKNKNHFSDTLNRIRRRKTKSTWVKRCARISSRSSSSGSGI